MRQYTVAMQYMKLQCPWHKVAVPMAQNMQQYSIPYMKQCSQYKHAAVHSTQHVKKQCSWHIAIPTVVYSMQYMKQKHGAKWQCPQHTEVYYIRKCSWHKICGSTQYSQGLAMHTWMLNVWNIHKPIGYNMNSTDGGKLHKAEYKTAVPMTTYHATSHH